MLRCAGFTGSLKNKEAEPDMSKTLGNLGVAAAASSHADLLVRITELTRALVDKGLISKENIKSSMTDEERLALRLSAVDRFMDDAERIAREEGVSE
jgi:hypothetical protein